MPKKLVFLAVAFLLSATPVTSNGYTQIGDVIISRSDDSWKCDQLECPIETTFRCAVIKRNSPDSPQTLVRENICYSESNEVLKTISSDSAISGNQIIFVNIQMNKNGAVSSSSSSGSVNKGNGGKGSSGNNSVNRGSRGTSNDPKEGNSNTNTYISGNQNGNFDAAEFREIMREFRKDIKDELSNLKKNMFDKEYIEKEIAF